MGYQIYVKNVFPDGPCDPLEEHREKENYGCISGKSLGMVPGVWAYAVDGYNAIDTAQTVRAWASDVHKCLDWIRECMDAGCTITLTDTNIIHAHAEDGSLMAYRVTQLVEHCYHCKRWSSEKWTPKEACWDLESEIEDLIMMAEWLEKNAGKEFDHSY